MKYFFVLIIHFQSFLLFCQKTSIGYVWEQRQEAEFLLTQQDTFFQSGILPFLTISKSGDSILNHQLYNISYQQQNRWYNFLNHSIIQVKDSDFVLHIIPLLNLRFTNDSIHRFTENTRGIYIYGQLSDNFSFVSGATETQVFFPDYIKQYFQNNQVIPGNGRVRSFKQTGYDYSKAFGHIVYTPGKYFHVMVGHVKQFVGYGYRSVLLSDAPYEYPLIKFSVQSKKFQYQIAYASFQSASAFDDRTKVYSRIFSSIHYLSYFVCQNWQVALFENTLFQPMSAQNNRPPEEFYLPLPFVHTAFYGFNSRKNVMTGIQSQWSPINELKLYGQFALDDYSSTDSSRKKIAWQYGIKINEPFRIKKLFILAEYNRSLPYTYATDNAYSNFTQHNEPIAHILGNHFSEFIVTTSYQYKFLFARIKYNRATYCPSEKRLTACQQNTQQTINQYRFEIGLKAHKPSRLELLAGYHYRQQTSSNALNYFYVSLSTRLFNFYDDF